MHCVRRRDGCLNGLWQRSIPRERCSGSSWKITSHFIIIDAVAIYGGNAEQDVQKFRQQWAVDVDRIQAELLAYPRSPNITVECTALETATQGRPALGGSLEGTGGSCRVDYGRTSSRTDETCGIPGQLPALARPS